MAHHVDSGIGQLHVGTQFGLAAYDIGFRSLPIVNES